MIEFTGIIHLYTEKIVGCGEDSMLYKFNESGNGYMFVFDGCGGAGSQKHILLDNKKSAYVASRACAIYLEKYLVDNELNNAENAEIFGKSLNGYLLNVNAAFPMEESDSQLVDVLPTTISGALINNDDNGIKVNFVWAGDSRGYIIDSGGLSQVTEDDVDSEDAFTNITDDSIMNNRIHGSDKKKMFEIHSSRIEIKDKCILICATDGCYDYFVSPMVFEFLLLSALMASNNFVEVEEHLNQVLKEQSGDDYSLVMACFGFESYEEIKQFICDRYQLLDSEKNLFGSECARNYWNEKYKDNYYRYCTLRSKNNG